ncbi:transcriptional regulator [Thiomicrospira aerophila AL3]|uniref:Transcriptional regulator n=1 Tax=Thiomicrospira aerophila AL3 TaxID=717772 RepID=W0DVQ8_9GAMM|nr:DNA-binding protein [Thiomicrospira aerophila]AHF01368.1 transcriptional regulator [Thiomicrospira aerophila AL3]
MAKKSLFNPEPHIPQNGKWPERLTDIQAAAFINTTPSTIRISRTTGKLWGVTAPHFIKIGSRVFYELEDLELWIKNNTTKQISTADSAFC